MVSFVMTGANFQTTLQLTLTLDILQKVEEV